MQIISFYTTYFGGNGDICDARRVSCQAFTLDQCSSAEGACKSADLRQVVNSPEQIPVVKEKSALASQREKRLRRKKAKREKIRQMSKKERKDCRRQKVEALIEAKVKVLKSKMADLQDTTRIEKKYSLHFWRELRDQKLKNGNLKRKLSG